MQERIEPPVLLSRLMMFVFAGTVVVLFVMLMTLEKMFPLNRPEIFFITNKPESVSTLKITEMPPDSQSLDNFKQAFILEYIRARNEVDNATLTRARWRNSDGIMATWSSENVRKAFEATALYKALTQDYPDFELKCHVNFLKKPMPLNRARTLYSVEFEYHCDGNQEQTNKRKYTIRIGLDMNTNSEIEWRERLNNPLGITVSEYKVESGGGDPLDMISK